MTEHKYELVSMNEDDNEYKSENDIEKNISNENTNSDSINTCVICLEENNNTSIACKCKNKFHSKCIDDMIKNNIVNCPLCKKKINKSIPQAINTNQINNSSQVNNSLREDKCLFNILYPIFVVSVNVIGIVLCFTYIISIANVFMTFLLFPSDLKYCDNVYKKCEYFSAHGILINNTISERIEDFELRYTLESTFKFQMQEINLTGICSNLDHHEYKSYSDALLMSSKTIGLEEKIFVSHDYTKCKLNYRYYNPKMFAITYLSVLNLILTSLAMLCCLIISFGLDEYSLELHTWMYRIKAISRIFLMIIIFISLVGNILVSAEFFLYFVS